MSDLAKTYENRLKAEETQRSEAFLDSLSVSDNQGYQEPDPVDLDDTTAGKVSKDIGRGIIEVPTQIVGGIADAANSTIDLFQETAYWVNQNVLGGNFDVPKTSAVHVITTPEAESTTGGIVRQISEFATLFAQPGKINAVKALREMSTGGRIAADAIQGFVADFIIKPEKNLNNMIQEYPALQNPVSEFMAIDEADDDLTKRLKTAVEGIGAGVAFDTFFTGLKSLKNAKKFKKQIVDNKVVPEEALSEESIKKASDMSVLGDVSKPLFKAPKKKVDPNNLLKETTQDEGEVFINWARIDSDDDIKSLMQNMADHSKSSIDTARRGVRTHEQTKLSANEKDAWNILMDLNERGPGATLNAEESVALRDLWVQSSTKLRELTELAATDKSASTQFAFRKMLSVHGAIQEKAIAARTEAARALNSWKIPVNGDLENMLHVTDVLAAHGGAEVTDALASKMLSLMDDPIKLNAYTRGSVWVTSREAASQLWYFSLLSGPHTHARNFISNTATNVLNIAERKAASMIGDEVAPEEAMSIIAGQIEGMKQALRISNQGRKVLAKAGKTAIKGDVKGAKSLIAENADEFGTVYKTAATGVTGHGTGMKTTGIRPENVSKLVNQMVSEPLSQVQMSEAMRSFAGVLDTSMQVGAKGVDIITGSTGRALETADELFKTIAYHSETYAQATRKARQMVKSGEITEDLFDSKVAELISDPDEFMRIASRKQSEYLTFTNNPDQTSKVWRAIKGVGNVPVMGKLIMPFQRVVYNIGSYTFERTPFAPLVRNWRSDIAAGGARKDIALARMTLGTAALLTAADFSMRGHITGAGSPDYGEKATDRRMNIQPNSIKLGNRYYSYRGLEPISSPFSIASNIVEIASYMGNDDNPEFDEVVIATGLAIGNQMINQQYMSGVSSMFEGMSDPTRNGENWIKSIAGSMIPAGLSQTNRVAVDPYIRQVENYVDAMRAKIPGASKGIPYKRDLWGRKIDIRSGLGVVYDALSPVYSKEFKPEPIDKELKAIEYYPEELPRKISFQGMRIDMEEYPEAWSRMKELAGNAATKTIYGAPIDPITNKGCMDTLNLIVQGKHAGYPMYKMMTDTGKADTIKKVIRQFRDASKEHILKEYPKIKANVDLMKADHEKKYIFQ